MNSKVISTEGESASTEETAGIESIQAQSASSISSNNLGMQMEAALRPLVPGGPTPESNPKISVGS